MATASVKGKRILVAEDETAYARALTLKLQRSGFEVETVGDGEAAIAALQKSSFALLMLDLIMPKKDGFAVLEELKKSGKKMPVIVLSNLGQAEDEEKAKALGATDFLGKANTSIAEVIEKVTAALH